MARSCVRISMGVPSGDDFIEVNTSKAEFITFDFIKHGMNLFAVTFKR